MKKRTLLAPWEPELGCGRTEKRIQPGEFPLEEFIEFNLDK
jgi:hypothetical protein